jgi:subtilisin family serine protease
MTAALCRTYLAALVFVLTTEVPAWAVIHGVPPTPDSHVGRSAVALAMLNGTFCSGTIVGPRIILTAAHCVSGAPAAPVFAKVGGRTQEVTCAHYPRYTGNVGDDLALCVTANPFANQPLAHVGVDPQRVVLGGTVTLVGYGCRLEGGIDRSVGQLTWGTARVVRVNGTEAALAGAAVCFGDAGGGAFTSSGGGDTVLVGVISRGNLQDRSDVALTTTRDFVMWARSWSEERGGICGISGANPCADVVTAGPPPPPDPSGRAQTADELLTPPPSNSNVEGIPVHQFTRMTLRKGETLDDGVARACGPVSEEYFKALGGLQHDGRMPLVRGIRSDADVEIDILPCPRSVTGFPRAIRVRDGDTIWGYYLANLREQRDAGWRGFAAPAGSPAAARAFYFVEAVRALNPGVNTDVLTRDMSLQLPTVPTASLARNKTTAAASSEVKAVLALQGADGECIAPDSDEGYPFDVEALLDVLARNRAKRSALHLDAKPVLVLTADTGIFGAGQGIFRNDGIILQNGGDYDDLRPLSEGPDPMHGTEVAALLLGGPFLSKLQAIGPRRIQLVSRRIYTQTVLDDGKTFYSAEPDVMDSISNQILDGAQIVNLSLKTSLSFPDLKTQARDPSARALFIAAAGNRDGQLADPEKAVYPAMYGGVGARNLLVVAALDGEGGLAQFSNYGTEYVEIGAPGCLVPTLSAVLGAGGRTINFDLVQVTGTSVATPLVAFGAALLKSERAGTREMLPIQVKRRLLASADLRTTLTRSIADGRALNIVKAASVFHDVVELKDASRLVFGEVTFIKDQVRLEENHLLEFICDGTSLSLKVSDILKVVPAFVKEGRSPTFKVYARSSNDVLRNLDCETPAGLNILVHDSDQDTEAMYRLDEIADIVRREQ